MACNIRQNDQIQSIKIKNDEVKFSFFADDVTCFLSNKSSYGHSKGNGEGSNLLKEFMSKASPIHVSTDLIQVAKKNFLFHLE